MSDRVAVFSAIRSFALYRSRIPLMKALSSADWRVIAATSDDRFGAILRQLGFELVPVPFARGGLSPARDLRTLVSLAALYRRLRPDLIHHFNIRPLVVGTAAARLTAPQAAVVNTVTGLGNLPSVSGWRGRVLGRFLAGACRRARRTIFQNPDDLEYFLQCGWVSSPQAEVIIGSGVDTELFHPSPACAEGKPVVLMVSRLLGQKGVGEFLEVARRIRRARPDVSFQLAGELEPDHPDALPVGIVDESVARGDIEFLGYVSDIERVLARAALFVYPSRYREGVPRVLLEAAACGVPAVAADVPGSREAVVAGRTGWLVNPSSETALTDAVADALSDTDRLASMGKQAREWVVAHFDLKSVTESQLAVYRDVGCPIGEQRE